jgi:hypothetical protein
MWAIYQKARWAVAPVDSKTEGNTICIVNLVHYRLTPTQSFNETFDELPT